MRIAIVGAGFSGLATAWYLLSHSQAGVSIDLYDPRPIGGGVSGLSSGLLHLYAGKQARRAPDAEKKMDAIHQLFGEASRAIGKRIVLSKGILRPAITPQQIADFSKAQAEHHEETEWWVKERCEAAVDGLKIPLAEGGGLFIPQGLTIDVPTYLEGLWKAIALFGTQHHQREINNESELNRYERVIFTLGGAITHFPLFSSLPVERIKGQVLKLRLPSRLKTLPFSVISEGYLALTPDPHVVMAGATFEREFRSEGPDIDIAVPEIRKKIAPFFPIEECEMVGCEAGVRGASKHTHQPLMGQLTERVWFLTGLGGKGLLYHAYLGDLLAQAVLKGDASLLPRQMRYGR